MFDANSSEHRTAGSRILEYVHTYGILTAEIPYLRVDSIQFYIGMEGRLSIVRKLNCQ